jgi:hypothetical protein
MHRCRRIYVVCWIDSKPVFLLSTAINPVDPTSTIGRWIGRERVDFPTSPVLLQYQSNMRGMDLVDQKREYYSIQLQSHKWWHRLMLFVVESYLDNSHILHEADNWVVGLVVLTCQCFRYVLAQTLVGPFVRAQNIHGGVRNVAPRGLH